PHTVITGVRADSTPTDLKEALSSCSKFNDRPPLRVFLILRIDTILQKNMGTFQQMLGSMESGCSRPFELETFIMPPPFPVIRKGLLQTKQDAIRTLESVCGPPHMFRESGTFIHISHQFT
ncbi:MAG TPA: hypothetical protein VJ521_03070, partial [Acidobacteriota bacterium]|nr:hypothetical protein [Acidobacteriota bacterium]